MKQTIITPVGTAKFTKVDKPDTSFNPEGEFVAVINLDKTGQAELMATLEPIIEQTLADLKSQGSKVTKSTLKLPFKTEEDGTTTIKTKVKASAVNRETGQTFNNFVRVLDSTGEDFTTVPMIGQGSKLRATVELVPYTMNKTSGISFRLKEVQVVDLVEVQLKTTSDVSLAKTSTNPPF